MCEKQNYWQLSHKVFARRRGAASKSKPVVFRRSLRSVVGTLGDVDWIFPWQENFPHWKEPTKFFTVRHGLKTWPAVCLGHSKFATSFSSLQKKQRVVRSLKSKCFARSDNLAALNTLRTRRWNIFRRHKGKLNWREGAEDIPCWMNEFDDFVPFTDNWWTWNVVPPATIRQCQQPMVYGVLFKKNIMFQGGGEGSGVNFGSLRT